MSISDHPYNPPFRGDLFPVVTAFAATTFERAMIRNPATGRMVKADGRIGRMIIKAQQSALSVQKQHVELPAPAIQNIAKLLVTESCDYREAVNLRLVSKQFANTVFFSDTDKTASLNGQSLTLDTLVAGMLRKRQEGRWRITETTKKIVHVGMKLNIHNKIYDTEFEFVCFSKLKTQTKAIKDAYMKKVTINNVEISPINVKIDGKMTESLQDNSDWQTWRAIIASMAVIAEWDKENPFFCSFLQPLSNQCRALYAAAHDTSTFSVAAIVPENTHVFVKFKEQFIAASN